MKRVDIMEVQWYPGHMAKTKRLIKESLPLVDVVIELLDARIPISSQNPDIDEITADKKRIIVCNKWDLSDETISLRFKAVFEERGHIVVPADCKRGKGIDDIEKAARLLMKDKVDAQKAKGRLIVPIRAMAIGIPNVGKSTLINCYAKKEVAKAEDRPGVTRKKQWIKVKKDFEILDTPGILWHKFDDRDVGLKIAFTGGVKDDIIDIVTLALELLSFIIKRYSFLLEKRYGINDWKNYQNTAEILEAIGKSRGYKMRGGIVDTERTAVMLIDEFRAGKLGKITLDYTED